MTSRGHDQFGFFEPFREFDLIALGLEPGQERRLIGFEGVEVPGLQRCQSRTRDRRRGRDRMSSIHRETVPEAEYHLVLCTWRVFVTVLP